MKIQQRLQASLVSWLDTWFPKNRKWQYLLVWNCFKCSQNVSQEENPEASMFFLQLPAKLPIVKQSPKSEGPQTASSTDPADKSCSLDELPAGFMGKMLVYKSGAVKLKLGDTIYDVSRNLILW